MFKSSKGTGSLSSLRISRSKLYERYNVELPPAAPSSNKRKSWRGWFNNDVGDKTQQEEEQLPPDQWTNVQMIRYILKNSSLKTKLITILMIMMLSSLIKSIIFDNNDATITNDSQIKRGPVMTKYGLRPEKMDPDSHKRSNPFAPPDHQSYMEGVLEVKKVKKRVKPPPPSLTQQMQQEPQQKQLKTQQQQPVKKKGAASRGDRNRMPSQKKKNGPEKKSKVRKMPPI